MIITKLIGGLGNQMFQYAAGFKVASSLNTELKLDTNAFDSEGVTRRMYELDIFNISAALATSKDVSKLKFQPSRILKKFPSLINIIELSTGKSHIFESKEKFRKTLIPNNSYLEGHWYSADYFKGVEKQIRKEFVFKNLLDNKDLALKKEIEKNNSVSIHIRRGDYVTNKKVNKYIYTCSENYYKKAIQIVRSKISHPTFYIFSDDLNWARTKFSTYKSTKIITGNKGSKSYQDMELMSHCKHHIIANSSFSWWGAWLNPDKSKLVISPKNWFRDTSYDHGHLVPTEWMRI